MGVSFRSNGHEMKLESSNATLTELEGAVLATITERGPMTAYGLKEVFRRSPSGFWSGSAGAVYPLVKRLEARGLLTSAETSASKRPKREFTISPEGRRLMQAWIADVTQATNLGYDPLRTRAQFSHLLDQRQRNAFFDAVEDKIMDAPAPPDASDRVGLLHGHWLKARAAWFRAFRKDG